MGRKGDASWIDVLSGLTDVYLTNGDNDEAIAASRDMLELDRDCLERDSLERARIHKKMGMAYFKKGDWAKCEEHLVRGLGMIGEKAVTSSAKIPLKLTGALGVHVLHSLFPGLFRFRKAVGTETDKEIIRFYLVMGWMYLLSDTGKFLYSILRTVNIAESRIEPSNELGIGLGGYATICMALPLPARAITYHERALSVREQCGSEWGVAQSLQWLGYCHSWNGDHSRSLRYFHDAADRFKAMGDMWEYGQCVNGLGHGFRYSGEYDNSIEQYREYLRVSRKINDNLGSSSAMASCGYALLEKGEVDAALKLLLEAEEVSHRSGIHFIECYSSIHLGVLKLERGDHDEAMVHLSKAEKLSNANRFLKDYTVYLYAFLAQCLIEKAMKELPSMSHAERRRRGRTINRYTRKALKLAAKWPNHLGTALRIRATQHAFMGAHRRAHKVFAKSIEHTKANGRTYELAKCYYEYANFLISADRIEAARHYWGEAWKLFKEIGASRYVVRCSEALGLEGRGEAASDRSMTRQERFSAHRRMATLIAISRHLSAILDLNELLERIMDSAIETIGAERGSLVLYREEGGLDPEMTVSRNISVGETGSGHHEMSRAILERIQTEKTPLIVEDALTEASLKERSSVVREGIRSVLCAPITVRGTMIGLIYLDNRMVSGVFTDEDLEVLDLLSSQAGVSIENARLYKKAVKDGLTGLYNRAFFDNFLMKSVSLTRRYHTRLSLLLLDIDHFKQFNDTYGHQGGDVVLKSVAATIEGQMRGSDVACRYGGEEFVVVLPETDIDGAVIFAEKLRRAIETLRVPLRSGIEVTVTMSGGVGQFHEDQERMTFVDSVDQALYEAKQSGRNRVSAVR